MHPNFLRAGAAALLTGTALNMFRMVPVFLSEGFSFNEFPPHSIEAMTNTALLSGWYVSHLFALISLPLLAYGFMSLYLVRRTSAPGSSADKLTLLGLRDFDRPVFMFNRAIRVAFARVAGVLVEAREPDRQVLGQILKSIHYTAASFGGHFMAFVMVGSGIYALGMYLFDKSRLIYPFGIIIGLAALAGTISGLLDLSFQLRFPLLAAMMDYHVVVGAAVVLRFAELFVPSNKLPFRRRTVSA